jgi:biotin carboxyl carrier protein
MKYFVRIADTEHEVTIDGENVHLDGRAVVAHIEDLPGTPLQIVAIGNEVHRILARRGTARGDYQISVDGNRFAVEVLDERARTIRKLSGSAAQKAAPLHLVAPMPGLIVRIGVQAGDRVKPGQGLVVMEAMKMENELRASGNATIKRVAVEPGSAVEKGALLLEMEG